MEQAKTTANEDNEHNNDDLPRQRRGNKRAAHKGNEEVVEDVDYTTTVVATPATVRTTAMTTMTTTEMTTSMTKTKVKTKGKDTRGIFYTNLYTPRVLLN